MSGPATFWRGGAPLVLASGSATRLQLLEAAGLPVEVIRPDVDERAIEADSMSDPAKYRTKEEVDEVKKTRDPIDHLKMLLAAAKATEEELKAIDNEVKAIVAEAVQFAQESPEPDPSELYTDVYVEA